MKCPTGDKRLLLHAAVREFFRAGNCKSLIAFACHILSLHGSSASSPINDAPGQTSSITERPHSSRPTSPVNSGPKWFKAGDRWPPAARRHRRRRASETHAGGQLCEARIIPARANLHRHVRQLCDRKIVKAQRGVALRTEFAALALAVGCHSAAACASCPCHTPPEAIRHAEQVAGQKVGLGMGMFPVKGGYPAYVDDAPLPG